MPTESLTPGPEAARPAGGTPGTAAEPLPLGYPGAAGGERMTRFRWLILALIFFGTTVNYLDRQVMGILAPGLQKQYSISDVQYGYIQSAFALSYAFGQLVSGGVLDRIGTRIGYAVALAAWS